MNKFEILSNPSLAIAPRVAVNNGCVNLGCPAFNGVCANLCGNLQINQQCNCPQYDVGCFNTGCPVSPNNPQCDISGRFGRPSSH